MELPGLGFKTYYVRQGNGTQKGFTATTFSNLTRIKDDLEDIIIQNKVLKFFMSCHIIMFIYNVLCGDYKWHIIKT